MFLEESRERTDEALRLTGDPDLADVDFLLDVMTWVGSSSSLVRFLVFLGIRGCTAFTRPGSRGVPGGRRDTVGNFFAGTDFDSDDALVLPD